MADEEAEQDRSERSDPSDALNALSARLEEISAALSSSQETPDERASQYCYEFCQTLVEYASLWRMEEEPLPVLEVYIMALMSFAQVCPLLSAQCEKVPVVLERLSLSCAELLVSMPRNIPDALWERFRSSVQMAHPLVQEKGISHLLILSTIARGQGVWTNPTLQAILTNDPPPQETVREFLSLEGPALLRMRVKHLVKESCVDQAAALAKACAEFSGFEETGHFKQMHLVCLCTSAPQELIMEELSKVDCRDALEMICNLEADGDEKAAFTLCSGFLTRQILQEDTYCAWELTLFWGKLLKRLEPSDQGFLDRCRQMSFLSKTVFHLLFFIKVIQSEMDKVGLSTCVEICIRALRLESCEGNTKATVCKTISCLLPSDLEVKRACQLTEFLLEPTVDSYYAVETLYNEPDQKLDEEDLPVPNSLRCELLLVLKTQWPFDPEFWNWKALKRHCLALMGEEASIVSSIDELNDGDPEGLGDETGIFSEEFKDVSQRFLDTTNELNEIEDQKLKNRELKKLREKGFVSARFRNWQAYMQYCVLCDKEFLGHRIVRHAQTHLKDGLYSCPICLETFETKETLEPHVASHVKLSCKERLAAMKTSKQLANPKTAVPVIAALKAKSSENQARKTKTKNNSAGQSNKLSNGVANDSDGLDFKNGCEGNICPVQSCRRGFKYFRNLVAHVKDHGDNEEAKCFLEMQNSKVVCQYCRRQFVSVDHLNDHLQAHCGTKPYICIQLNCKASFDSNADLIIHKKDHPVFKAKCMFPGCGKIFSEAYKLYDHEAQHYRTFTCKAPDCGKVFHSQSELDLHAEGHVVKVEAFSTSIQPAEPHPDHSNPTHQGALPDAHLNDDDTGSQVDNPSGMGTIKHSVENMLNSAFSAQEECVHSGTSKPEPHPIHPHIPVISDHLGQSAVGPHLIPHRPEESLLEALMSDSDPMPSTSSYQSVLEDFLPVPPPDGQLQAADSGTTPLYNNNNGVFRHYGPNPLPPVQTSYQSLCSTNMTSPAQTSHNTAPLVSLGQMLPPVSQTLPLQMASVPNNGQVSESKSVKPVDVNVVQVEKSKERHKCPYETCTRDYSSYRSVTKHMKAVHSDFYTQWKLAKKNNVAVKSTLRPVSVNGSLSSVVNPQAQLGQRVAGPVVHPVGPHPPYPSNCANPSYPSVPAQVTASPGHIRTNEMDNILDPIVLSQLGNGTNQSQMAADHLWDPRSNSVLQQQICNSQTMTQNMNTLPSSHFTRMNAASSEQRGMSYTTLQPQNNTNVYPAPAQADSVQKLNGTSDESLHPVGNLNPPQQILGPNVVAAVNSVVETNLGSAQMSYADSSVSKDASADYTQQTSDNFSVVSNSPCVVKLERDTALGLPLPINETPPSNSSSPSCQNNTGNVPSDKGTKKVKRSKRTKWPAIIKDGKFICCRCYREFPSSKSLGGHLSKRAHCKPFDEADLTADLPSSFLDLLNSPHPAPSAYVNLPQSKGPLDPKLYPNVTFPQANGTYNSNDKQMVFKQSSSNLCVSSGQEQQTLPNPCGPYAQSSRMSETSVIQHTGSVKHQLQASYSEMPLFNDEVSDPLLSQLLADDQSTSSLTSGSSDHVSQILQAETFNKMKEFKEKITDSASDLSNDGLLAAMASLAQNLVSEKSVKERLRQQILAGDLYKKSSLPRGSSVDSSYSQMSVASPDIGDPLNTSNFIENAPQSEPQPVGNTAPIVPVEAISQLGEGVIHTVSSVSSGSGVNDQSTNMPATEVDAVLEIQKALENLDLDREINEVIKPVAGPVVSDASKAPPTKPEPTDLPKEIPIYVKPFACDTNGCNYSCMTKDALFKHLVKLHNYTEKMLTQMKDQFNISPFGCHKCSKAFTRNSNLKAHYMSVHNFTQEEIKRMKIRPKPNHRLLDSDGGSPCPVPEIPKPVKNTPCGDARKPQKDAKSTAGLKKEEKVKTSRCITPLVQQSSFVCRSPALGTPAITQKVVQPSVIVSGRSSATPRMDLNANGWFSPKSSVPGPTHVSPLKEILPIAPFTQNPCAPVQTLNQALDKKPKPSKPRVPKPKESPKKTKEKKADIDDAFSPYRPYRCVHQGCAAAFTIQQNLILHYKAVHQSDLPKFEVNSQDEHYEEEFEDKDRNEDSDDKLDADIAEVDEFRCQVKDCSCIFQSVTDLLQHYLQLHKLALEKAGAMMCSINLGRFQCDQPNCSETFTAFWKYIGHVDKDHKETKLSKVEPVEGMFRCQVEGCECAYSTRSNLLRHTMKKHQDVYKRMLMNPREGGSGVKLGRPRKCDKIEVVEKENRETNKKPVKKVTIKKDAIKKDAIKKDGVKKDSVKKDAVKKDTVKKDTVKKDTVKKDTVKKEYVKKEYVKKEYVKKEYVKKEYVKKDAIKKYKIKKDTMKKEAMKKVALKKRKAHKNNWTKYGKPILKTQEEASAMCTKRLQLQYACMIKGCETVTSSERNIMKHYLQHGLPKQYLEEQRSNFIYCKKIPRSRYKRIASRSDDTDKSEESSIETTENEEVPEPGQSESEFSKLTSEKESAEDVDLSDGKPSTDSSSEISVVVKRRRGRPRKSDLAKRAFGPKRMTRLRTARSSKVSYVDSNTDSMSSSTTVTQEDVSGQNTPLSSFKPMGFEVSFLQFLQENKTPQKRKATVPLNGNAHKRLHTAFHLKTATVVCKRSDAQVHSRETHKPIEFKNPQKLTSLANVTFEVQKVFSDVLEILLKQLHEMRPTVILQKDD